MHQLEGGKVHFEARIEPVGDPTMVVEWFLNGKPLAASKFIDSHSQSLNTHDLLLPQVLVPLVYSASDSFH